MRFYCTDPFCTSDRVEAGFKTKAAWKAHEKEFHETKKKYICDHPGCSSYYTKKAGFQEHHKTHGGVDHSTGKCEHADRCAMALPPKCAWGCCYCLKSLSSFDEYFDHIARDHYSNTEK